MSDNRLSLLLIEDSSADANLLMRYLHDLPNCAYQVTHCTQLEDGLKALDDEVFDCVIIDYKLGERSGLDGLRTIRSTGNDIPIIALSGQGNEAVAVEAIKGGAQDYLTKREISGERLNRAVSTAMRQVDLKRQLLQKQEELQSNNRLLQSNLFLQKISNQILQMKHQEDWDQIVLRLFDQLHELIQFDGCSIGIVDIAANKTTYYLVATHQVPLQAGEPAEPADRPVLQQFTAESVSPPLLHAVQTGQYVYRYNRGEMARWDPDFASYVNPKINSILDVPFANGTVAVNSTEEEAFDEAAISILQETAEILSMAIGRRRELYTLSEEQRIRSIGHLAAGVAHEINSPMQFIGDNIYFLKESFATLEGLHKSCTQLLSLAKRGELTAAAIAAAEADLDEQDFDYILKKIPEALEDSSQGVDRVRQIVYAMKDLAHPGTGQPAPENLNLIVERATAISSNEWKYVAKVDLQLEPSLPQVPCLRGELSQVFVNLLVNAAHAIADANPADADCKGKITLSTRRDGNWVEAQVQDTGGGIPAEVQPYIFDPFFTTKEVGRGTGQGLAICRDVIVSKHGGELTFVSTEEGTAFIVRLPLEAPLAIPPPPIEARA